jgi:hypothetical protein
MYHTHVLDRRGTRQELQESRNKPPALIPSSIPIPPCPPLPPIPPMPPFMPLSSSSIPPIPNDLGEWKGAQTHPTQHTPPNTPHPTNRTQHTAPAKRRGGRECTRKTKTRVCQRYDIATTLQTHHNHIKTTSQPQRHGTGTSCPFFRIFEDAAGSHTHAR